MNSSVPPQSNEYGGDEINAIVFDPGSHTIRAGFAGEDTPKSVIPSFYGARSNPSDTDDTSAPSSRDYLFGDNKLHNPRSDVEIKTPFSADGLIDDWDVAEKLFEFAITSRLTGSLPTPPSRNGLNDHDDEDKKSTKDGADADGDVKMSLGEDEGDAADGTTAAATTTTTNGSHNQETSGGGDAETEAARREELERQRAKAIDAAAESEKLLAEHPILMTEPSGNPTKIRVKCMELALEQWGAPAFFLSKTGGLAAFSQGKPTALVIDVGANVTSVTPVFDGFVLHKGVQKSRLAGNFISDQIRLQLAQMTPPAPLVPYYMVKSKTPVDAGSPANAVYTKFDPPSSAPTNSFRRFQEERVLTSFKESMVQVWAGPGALDSPATSSGAATNGSVAQAQQQQPANIEIARAQLPKPFEMPDGWNQIFGIERFRVAEGLFDVKAALRDSSSPDLDPKHTIPSMVQSSLNAIDVEIRPQLLGNIVLTGGGSLIANLAERIQSDLAAMYPNPRVRVLASGQATDRKFGAWIGGSIQASLGTFHQMWISKKEYDEHGVGIIDKRCK